MNRIGCMLACSVFGPGLGFICGGLLLQIYVDVGRVDMDEYVYNNMLQYHTIYTIEWSILIKCKLLSLFGRLFINIFCQTGLTVSYFLI